MICFIMGLLLFSLTGCLSMTANENLNVAMTAALAEITAREIGYTVAETQDAEIDRTLRNFYTLAKTGELSQDGMNQITDTLSKKIKNRPTLPKNIMSLLKLVGVRFSTDGAPIGLDKIPPEVFEAVEFGYIDGFKSFVP